MCLILVEVNFAILSGKGGGNNFLALKIFYIHNVFGEFSGYLLRPCKELLRITNFTSHQVVEFTDDELINKGR